MIGNVHEVLHFNRLFLELKLVHMYWAVRSLHMLQPLAMIYDFGSGKKKHP